MRPITCPNCLHEIRRPHGRPKITKDIRDMIREDRRKGLTLRTLAAMYEVSSGTIHYIIHEKSKRIL